MVRDGKRLTYASPVRRPRGASVLADHMYQEVGAEVREQPRRKREDVEMEGVFSAKPHISAPVPVLAHLQARRPADKQDERAQKVKDIAQATEDLTERNAVLNDDRMYLKDLTSKSALRVVGQSKNASSGIQFGCGFEYDLVWGTPTWAQSSKGD